LGERQVSMSTRTTPADWPPASLDLCRRPGLAARQAAVLMLTL
jgi:hypothetical protein